MRHSLLLCLVLTSFAASAQSDALTSILRESRPTDIVLGAKEAPVVAVSYVELHANPFAKTWAEAWGPLLARYPKQLKLVLRDFPMKYHQGAELNARAGHGVYELAGPEAFLRFASIVAQHRGDYTEELLAGFAARAGVADAAAFEARLARGDWAGPLLVNGSDVSTAGITGSPTTFVNGVRFAELHSLDRFAAAVDRAQAKGPPAAKSAGEWVVQPGRSVGPFVLGMTPEAVKALGFRSRERDGWWYLAINPENDATPIELRFSGGKLARIHLHWEGLTSPLVVGAHRLSGPVDLKALRGQLHCDPVVAGEGGSQMKCPGGDEITFGGAACRSSLRDSDCGPPGTPGAWQADYRVVAPGR